MTAALDPAALDAALDAIPTPYSGNRKCRFAAWTDTLDAALAAKVWAAVMGDRSYREVAKAITRGGYSVSPSTINNHRKGECVSCSKTS